MHPERIRRAYDSWAADYDAKTGPLVHNTLVPSMLVHRMPRAARVLDLGCGTGSGAAPFFARGDTVVGVDLSANMLRQARKHPYAKLYCQNIATALDNEAPFDAAIMLSVLELVDDPIAVFENIARALTSGGLLGVTFPRTERTQEPPQMRTKILTDDAIQQLLLNTGFAQLEKRHFVAYEQQGVTMMYDGYALRRGRAA